MQDEEQTKDISELTEELELAISELRFADAEKIKQQINSAKSDEQDDIAKKSIAYFAKGVKLCKSASEAKRRAFLKEINQKEIDVRKRYSERIQSMMNTHLTAATNLEDELFSRYKEIRSQPVPTYDTLIESAKIAAKGGDFTRAEQLLKQAKKEEAKQMKQRESQFVTSYKARFAAKFAEQKAEYQLEADNLAHALKEVDKERTQGLIEIDTSCRKQIQLFYQRLYSFINTKIKGKKPPELPEADQAEGEELPTFPELGIVNGVKQMVSRQLKIYFESIVGKVEEVEKAPLSTTTPNSAKSSKSKARPKTRFPPSPRKVNQSR